MSRHAMRTRRLRFKRAKKQRQSWKGILVPDGLLVGGPGMFDKLDAAFVASLIRQGVIVRESPYVPAGRVYGIAPQPLMLLAPREPEYEPIFDIASRCSRRFAMLYNLAIS